jgi:hypothetical protein
MLRIVNFMQMGFLFVVLGLSSGLDSRSIQKIKKPLPEKCVKNCITPYGKVLGVASGAVEAYSNCQAKCVIFDPHHYQSTYTGIKWQCVEFARRWLLAHHGMVYGDVDIASDIWTKIGFLTRVADGKKVKLQAHVNGSSTVPEIGDLLIYAQALEGTGHVAIVTGVDLKTGEIQVGEQNFSNQPWPANYARKISMLKKGDQFWLLDGYVLGWKRAVK